MASPSQTGYTQIITYIQRKPSLTPSQFYDHWQNVHARKVAPWAEKHGIKSYKQVHSSGLVLPNVSTASAPNASTNPGEPETRKPMHYDGIAMFEVTSLESFRAAFEDPYYVHVIEPDEHTLIDKDGFGRGIIATFSGKLVNIVEGGGSMLGSEAEEERKVWEEWERKK